MLIQKSATFGLALLVYEAIKLRDDGVNAEEIYNTLILLSSQVKFYAVVNTLKYLKMGGRLSSSAAVLGGVLQIKPLVSIIDGEVKSWAKERGQKAAFSWILDKLKKEEPDMQYPFAFGHSNAPGSMEEFITYITSFIEIKNPVICEIRVRYRNSWRARLFRSCVYSKGLIRCPGLMLIINDKHSI